MSEKIIRDGNYEAFVESINDGVVYCVAVEEDMKKFFLEIPVGDLEEVCDKEVRPGLIFGIRVSEGGENIDFNAIKRSFMSKDKKRELLEYYKSKYGDV